ncbi:MAG: hypothetical protein ACREEQ_08495, partial [Caulobacteraceae bacterium]
RVVEVGFGARPIRLAWLASAGIDVRGIDADEPMLRLKPSRVVAIWRRNGAERALKSAARALILGDKEWRDAAEAFAKHHPGLPFRVPTGRLSVGDAADPAVWAALGAADFIYSEDVFEHIEPDRLPAVVDGMAAALSRSGVALIRPQMFAGLAGGHSIDWYRGDLDAEKPRRAPPWDHLREHRFPANTYLNRLRYDDYVALFQRRFDIVETVENAPGCGARFLTREIEGELSAYSRRELLTNDLGFVLRPKAGPISA